MRSGSTPISDLIARFRRFRVTPPVELGVLALAVAIFIGSYFILTEPKGSQVPLTPYAAASLLIANLVPAVALIVLWGRRKAHRRAETSMPGGEGRLHVRLVALFSILSAVPMLFVTVFASLLFQYGVEFWFSPRAKGMLENSQVLAQQSLRDMLSYVDNENVAMSTDLSNAIVQLHWSIDSLSLTQLFAQDVYQRSLSEAVIFMVSPTKEIQTMSIVNPYDRDLTRDIDLASIRKLDAGQKSVVDTSRERTRSITRIAGTNLYLYAARVSGAQEMADRMTRAQSVLNDYNSLTSRGRALQVRFNIALLGLSLLIVFLAVLVALEVADRLVRPVSELVGAANRVAEGDLSARVPDPQRDDEVARLATAFNAMTGRLEQQTGALESRRALIEAVMGGVTAGVIALGLDGAIRVINASAQELLHTGEESPVGQKLSTISPELFSLVEDGNRQGVVEVGRGSDARTLAVKVVRAADGPVLTFDDITQQLNDQRSAAWADVARRIAHEIKNPLTPIQLAAERLQRRYGKTVAEDDTTFGRLTETIVRQVADLRRMVDEFSSFARMPKPIFRDETLLDVARQAMFLHEVAHPKIRFALEYDDPAPHLICDRRQIGQALTNVVKNAVEAVEAREKGPKGAVTMRLAEDDQFVSITLSDNGIGLPVERDRILEPYMTTRSRGTGLGLAIVKKIAEEHCGTIDFADRKGGGTVVVMRFDKAALHAVDCADDGADAAGDGRFLELTRKN